MKGPRQPVKTGRLERAVLLVVLIVLALGPRIFDAPVPAGSSAATFAVVGAVCGVIAHPGVPSLRATGR